MTKTSYDQCDSVLTQSASIRSQPRCTGECTCRWDAKVGRLGVVAVEGFELTGGRSLYPVVDLRATSVQQSSWFEAKMPECSRNVGDDEGRWAIVSTSGPGMAPPGSGPDAQRCGW